MTTSSIPQIVALSEELLRKEIRRTGFPILENHQVGLLYGKKLARLYGVDENFIAACMNFMDLKIGEAFLKQRLKDHIQMSLEATMEVLKSLDLDKKLIKKIAECIISHHGAEKYPSIEAEICANADCFKFLHPKGFLTMFSGLRRKDVPFDEVIDLLQQKLEEKMRIISLPELRPEAKNYYQVLSKIFELLAQ